LAHQLKRWMRTDANLFVGPDWRRHVRHDDELQCEEWDALYKHVVDVLQKWGAWPPMGVTIRSQEMIDGLQRQYLPPEFQDFKIPGSRPGTGYD
jgi:hypothetical protein